MTVVFLIGCGADEADIARFQVGFQHVRGIHGTLAGSTSANECVYLVDIDYVIAALLLHTVHDLLDAVLKVAPILCASQQRAHVELIDSTALQALGHPTLLYHPDQSPDKGCLAHTRFTHMQRIVLVAAAQHLNGALQLLFPSYQRVLLLVEVVHASDEPFPGCIRLAFTRICLQLVVKVIATDEHAHEITLLACQCFLQQKACPRLLQVQDTHHQMRNVQRLGAAVDHLLAGIVNHLTQLSRHLGFIVLPVRYCFQF